MPLVSSDSPSIPPAAQREFALALEASRVGAEEVALPHYHRAIAEHRAYGEAYNNLAVLLARRGRVTAAIAYLRRALLKTPQAPVIATNLGMFLHQQRRFAEAKAALDHALALAPEQPDALFVMGLLQRSLGDEAAAIQCFERALAQRPDHVETIWNRAMALLTSGDYARGFADYEVRWRRQETVTGHFTMPMWTGESLAGRAVLVHTEQGFGDTIQFSRFMPMLSRLGCRVLFSCPPEMMRLMAGFPGISDLLVFGAPLPCHVDYHAPLLSLPMRLGITLATLPAARAYLAVPQGIAAPRVPRLPDTRLIIGIVWAGNPVQGNDRTRSAPLEAFLTLADLPGVQLVSLQIGPRVADIAELGAEGLIYDLGSQIKDFAESAAIMAQLDLVVSVCSAPIHLAGALGLPGWAVLAHLADWRWMRERADTPWYPSLRLFRQRAPGDWDGVMRDVREAIMEKLGRS